MDYSTGLYSIYGLYSKYSLVWIIDIYYFFYDKTFGFTGFICKKISIQSTKINHTRELFAKYSHKNGNILCRI